MKSKAHEVGFAPAVPLSQDLLAKQDHLQYTTWPLLKFLCAFKGSVLLKVLPYAALYLAVSFSVYAAKHEVIR